MDFNNMDYTARMMFLKEKLKKYEKLLDELPYDSKEADRIYWKKIYRLEGAIELLAQSMKKNK